MVRGRGDVCWLTERGGGRRDAGTCVWGSEGWWGLVWEGDGGKYVDGCIMGDGCAYVCGRGDWRSWNMGEGHGRCEGFGSTIVGVDSGV